MSRRVHTEVSASMNIFVPFAESKRCAEALDDLRLNKMILETAQILSTALRHYNTSMDVYKATHVNHPCCVWARQNKSNYEWLRHHFTDLLLEKHHRTGKIHKSQRLELMFKDGAKLLPDGEQTPFVNCTKFKDIVDVHEAYRVALRDKWDNDIRPPKWTKRLRLF